MGMNFSFFFGSLIWQWWGGRRKKEIVHIPYYCALDNITTLIIHEIWWLCVARGHRVLLFFHSGYNKTYTNKRAFNSIRTHRERDTLSAKVMRLPVYASIERMRMIITRLYSLAHCLFHPFVTSLPSLSLFVFAVVHQSNFYLELIMCVNICKW